MIHIEFWNGMTSKKPKYSIYDYLVPTSHNPCLWSDVGIEEKPWRNVYTKALEIIDKWENNEINNTDFLHWLRYIAYGFSIDGNDKRSYDNSDVVWPGNLTINHRPKLSVKTNDKLFTLNFFYNKESETWEIEKVEDVKFYWELN